MSFRERLKKRLFGDPAAPHTPSHRVRITGPDGRVREVRTPAGERLIRLTGQHACVDAQCGYCVVELPGEPGAMEARVLAANPSGLCADHRLACHVRVESDLDVVVPYSWSLAEVRGGEPGD